MIGDNPVSGSLESLKDMIELCELDIENTQITDGLEWLNNDIKYFYCTGSPLLKNYPDLTNYQVIDEELISYDYLSWRENNPELVKQLEAKIEVNNSKNS